MELTMDRKEAEVLLRLLDNYLPQLREEVYKTENFDWRAGLKSDEVVVKSLIERLEQLKVKPDVHA